jgi:type II secretory pathway component PulJ
MTKRGGHTLIELLAVIGMSAIIMATAVGLLLSLFRLDTSSREHAAGHQSLARLEADFRADAHAATSLAPAGGKGQEIPAEGKQGAGWEFRFPQPDRSVRYAWRADSLVREEQDGKSTRRDG